MRLNDKTYDILNKIQRWIPALGVFYLALCRIWSFPFGDEVNNTIVAVAALMATTLEIANGQYQKDNGGNIDGKSFFITK